MSDLAELDRILNIMSEGFMRPEILEDQWATIEHKNGESETLPLGYLAFTDLADGDKVTIEDGFGARLSAPGYLDCTEWVVFDTEFDAKEYLVDMYGDDIEVEE